MSHLPTYKQFPGPTGVEVPAKVTISRPIPRRKIPLEGIKKMLFPAKPMEIRLGAETKTSWRSWPSIRLLLIWLLLVPVGTALFVYLSLILFALLASRL